MKIVIIGAGPVGALAAIYAAERGHEVEIYEFRDGMFSLATYSYSTTLAAFNSSLCTQKFKT